MLAKVRSAAVVGLDASTVEVEVDVSPGLPTFAIVGLPDAAVREARERVRAAIRNSGYEMPVRRITVNLAPADLRKEGPVFDLPIALGILAATQQMPPAGLSGLVALGELSLDGLVRPVPGILSVALALRRDGGSALLVPEANAAEAALVDAVPAFPVTSLAAAAAGVRGLTPFRRAAPARSSPATGGRPPAGPDLVEVRGHAHARRALEVAAAGGHNLLMIGPPGAGKTMLARRIPPILPPLAREEAIQVTQIYSVAGLLAAQDPLLTARPFRAPHHTTSLQALVGGGAAPRPGEISLAHLGVLFLDELPEFRRDAVEALRQPLEDGRMRIARVLGSVAFPARCMLLAAMNPCPCGYYGDAVRPCVCSPTQRRRYLRRLSGPLVDRIDLHIDVPRISAADVTSAAPGEPSASVRRRVLAARARQRARAAAHRLGAETNATIPFPTLRHRTGVREEVIRFLHQAIERLGLSPRAYERVLRVSQTIADLEDTEQVCVRHVAEALQYRVLDRVLPGPADAGA